MPTREDFDDLVCDVPAEVWVPTVPSTIPKGTPLRLHMEARYILDCAVELGDITPMECEVFMTQTPPAFAYSEMSERNESTPPHWLRNTARAYLDSLPLEHRYVWALRGLDGLKYGVQSFMERMAFLVQAKVQSDLGVAPRVCVGWMDEAGPGLFSSAEFSSVHAVTQEKVHRFLAAQFSEAKARLVSDVQLSRDALRWVSLPGNQEYARQIGDALFANVELLERAVSRTPPVSTLQQRKTLRERSRTARSAIKKAMKLFARTGFEENARLLVHGHEVEISNPESPFKFLLQPLQAGWLEQRTLAPGGHTPYIMTLLTKEDVFVSRLCVLFDQTPVLDQLLALTLFVRSGDELELLRKANWFGYESRTAVCAILAEKEPTLLAKFQSTPQRGAPERGGVSVAIREHDQREAHWAPYKGPVSNWILGWMAEIQEGLKALGLSTEPLGLT